MDISGVRFNPQAQGLTLQQQQTKMKELSKDFESFFLYQTLELMSPDTSENEFSGGHAEEMFRPILNEHVADTISQRGGIGIADKIYNQLLKYQELNNQEAAQ